MQLQQLKQRRILVAGLGVSGASVVRFLHRQAVPFDVVDERDSCPDSIAMLLTGSQCFNALTAELVTGYDTLILSPGLPRAHAAIQAAIKQGVEVIGDIELFAAAVQVPVLAVTGSNGKSTVVSWLAAVLGAEGLNAEACGNIGEPALDALAASVDCYVLELSSYQLESTRSLRPRAACVLNISDDHMDRYESLDDYAATKRKVYDNAQWLVFNADDPRTWPQADTQADTRADTQADTRAMQIAFALHTSTEDSSVKARYHRRDDNGVTWLCRDDSPLVRQSKLSVPGDHNAMNALAVLALAESMLPATADEKTLFSARLLEALAQFRGLAHRTELVGDCDGVRWYNDSKGTNVDACIKAIEAMPGPVILIAGGMAKDADFSPLRSVLERRVTVLLLLGRDRQQMADQLAGAVDIRLVASLREAIETARTLTHPGDVVLLSPACSSFDMFRNFVDRGEQFSAMVEEVLAA